MRGYSVRRMRLERRAWLLTFRFTITLFLIAAALCGAAAIHADAGYRKQDETLISALFLALALFSAGLYFLLTDEKQLLRRTRYGKALALWGDAKQLAQMIDRQAVGADAYEGRFLLLSDWIVLYQGGTGGRPVVSLPIPRQGIQTLNVGPGTLSTGGELSIVTRHGDHFTQYLDDPRDILALAAWNRKRLQEIVGS
ncbi:MAG: hypothetical protein IJ662_10235 [Clostridia bacterium]|nr:hypothetical protein [Clostridia bacterium]